MTTTSTTEAKNTERLVEMRNALNKNTDDKLQLEIEMQKLISENTQLNKQLIHKSNQGKSLREILAKNNDKILS